MFSPIRMTFLASALLLSAAPASAEPLVAAGGKPGAAKSWTKQGATVVLTLAEGYDAAEVAKAVTANVEGAQAKAADGKVVVSGVDLAKLVSMLEKVDVDPAMDDVDAMLSALKSGGDDEEGSGSSIRATKAADFSDVLGKTQNQVEGKVVGVTRSRFPVVIVSVKVSKVPKGVQGIKLGQRITVVPNVKSKDGVVDPNHRASQLNVGAWYAQSGDTVVMRLGPKQKKGVWIAEAFERKGMK